MSQRSSASSAASGKSSASSAASSKSSAASSKSSASSAAGSSKGSASSAGSSKSSAAGSSKSGSSASGSSKSGSSASGTESDTTEKSISEIGGTSQASVSAATQYDVSVAQAASAYAQSARNLDQYSMAGPVNKDANKSMASAIQKLQSASKVAAGGGTPTGRKVFVMRHGERMDRLFPEWLTVAITDEGKYRPYDMNQPLTMIERVGGVGWAGYEHDSPITEMGALTGQMVGRGLKNCRIDIKQVVSSPALRCVQTANAILKAMENADLKICVEPGLFEWLAWYDKMPQWFEPATLAQTGKYRINEMYKPIMSVSDMVSKKSETTKEYSERIANVTKQLLEQFKSPGSTLIVGHGSSMDVAGRSLLGKPAQELNRGEMDQMGVYYPYCAIVALEEMQGGTWRVVPSALPQLTFLGFSNRFTPDYFNRA